MSFILLIFGIFLLTSPALALDPLVPACGRTDAEKLCTTCDFLVVAKNISDFILFYLVPALSALFFIWAGFLILLGGGLTAQVAKGQNIFRTTVYGLLIIFLSWMIVNTVIRTVARDENIAENWWKLECRETVGGALVPTDKARVPSNEDLSRGQPLAQDLLNLGIIFDANADCGGNFHARGNIQSIAAGNFPAVCSRDCKTKTPACLAGGQNGNISVNSRILEGLKGLHPNLKNKHGASFIVTSFTTGIHSPNSTHYTGEAVDIVVNSDDPAVWREARSFLRGFGGTPICERKSDSQDEPNCNLNLINHIHWTLRK
ncbi:MAG: hypothetical protein Q8R34_02300 [bacterium]|nr:hypothetical protein [bacterium]